MKSEVARRISSWYLLALPWGAARELALETALEMVALPGGEARELAMETALEMVWMQPFGPPNHNRRPEHYDVPRIAVWVFGWGSPFYMSTKNKRYE